MRTIEQDLDTRDLRRLRAEHRYLVKLERLERKCEPLIGELCRQGATVYYINLANRAGHLTGKTKERASYFELVNYLIRNHYVA